MITKLKNFMCVALLSGGILVSILTDDSLMALTDVETIVCSELRPFGITSVNRKTCPEADGNVQ